MKKVLLISALVVFALANCKPKAENEMKYWENNKKDAAEFSQKWPGFKTVLDTKLAEAQKIWDEALKLTDEQQKANKMKEANAKLTEITNKISQVKSKSDGIQKSIDKINQKKLAKPEDAVRSKAVTAAKGVIDEVEASMTGAKPANDADALKVLDDAIGKLISGQGDIDRAISSVEPKKQSTPGKKK